MISFSGHEESRLFLFYSFTFHFHSLGLQGKAGEVADVTREIAIINTPYLLINFFNFNYLQKLPTEIKSILVYNYNNK